MQGASWIDLIRRLPANLHDGLSLTLMTGAEVVVQRFVKLEADFVVLRGRMAGTQDSGRVVILPYAQLVAVNITKRLTEPEAEAIFGASGETFAASIPLGGEPAALTETPPEELAPEEAAPAKPAMPSKAELLKKLRARLDDATRR